MTKRSVLFISSIYVICIIGVLVLSKCYGDRWCPLNINHLDKVPVLVLLPFLPAFILSLATYRMHETIFRAWVTFARWWVPLSALAVFLTPNARGFIIIPYQSILAVASALLFLVISLGIIVWKWRALKK